VDFLTRLDLLGFLRETHVVIQALLGIAHVFGETLGRVVRRGAIDFLRRINAFRAAAVLDFFCPTWSMADRARYKPAAR